MFSRFQKNLRSRFIAGILIVVPLGVTYLMLKLLFNTVDNILAPFLTRLIGVKIPGLGLITTIIIIFILGFLGANVVGKRFVSYMDRVMRKVPLVKSIYISSKQLIETLSVPTSQSFKRVVIVEYPRNGLCAVGFVTKENVWSGPERGHLTAVFIPTTPNPTTGMMVLVSKSEITETDMSVEEAIKLVISGGILVPDDLKTKEEKQVRLSDPRIEAKG